jgi:hypothetical protein
MRLRNRMLALAMKWNLGDRSDGVLKLLPEARRTGVQAELEAMKTLAPEEAMRRLAGLREKQARRVDRLMRRRVGDGWRQLDPLVRNWVLQHGQSQDH